MSNTSFSPIHHRNDIDGLRYLAVLSVVLYHAFPNLVKGGFLGVDIFFVISGYLITSIICRELSANSFSIINFYVRRIKRIFPALIFVMVVSLIIGWFLFTAAEYQLLSKHSFGGSVFYTNFFLAKESGYFDASAHEKPLMHLWSLAIEEQFYIVWPLLLYVAYTKGFRNTVLCASLISLSFIFSIKLMHKSPVKAFYFSWLRSWELISGGLLASFTLEHTISNKFKGFIDLKLNRLIYINNKFYQSNILRDICSILGFLINVICILSFKKTASFPGWYAILPVIGTVLIIASGKDAWINSKILSSKWFVNIGLISYPLYLWHWPLLSFVFIMQGSLADTKVVLICLFISLVMAYLTYKFIENPIRSSRNNTIVPGGLIFCMVIVGMFSFYVYKNEGLGDRQANIVSMPPSMYADPNFLALKINCLSPSSKTNKETFDNPACAANSLSPQILVIGDSHVTGLSHYMLTQRKLDMVVLSSSGTLPFKKYINYTPVTHQKKDTISALRNIHDSINSLMNFYKNIEYIVIITRGPLYFSGKGFGIEESDPNLNGWVIEEIDETNNDNYNISERFVNGYVDIIKEFIAKGKKVIFVIDTPELGIDPKSCFQRPFNFLMPEANSCLLDRHIVDERQKEYRNLVSLIKARVPELMVYDATTAFCDEKWCYGKKDQVIYYGDDDHLNSNGAEVLAKDFVNWFQAIK